MEMSKSRELDQFYTNPNLAKKYYEFLNDKYDLSSFFLIEPSAGEGSFSSLFHKDSIAMDLEPKKDYIKESDFFDFSIDSINNSKPIFTIGNPPFGKNSSLAIKFLNKSGTYSDYVAFVLPKTFKKSSTQNKINLNLHLVFEEDLPKNSFLHNGEAYDVPCVFQIWKKEDFKREKIIEKKTSELFDFCKKEEGDFAIRRVGGLSGKVLEDFEEYKEASHYYLKTKGFIDKKLLIQAFKDCYQEFQKAAKNTAGNPSLSKGELIKIIELYFYK
jgi:hypothetical protein